MKTQVTESTWRQIALTLAQPGRQYFQDRAGKIIEMNGQMARAMKSLKCEGTVI